MKNLQGLVSFTETAAAGSLTAAAAKLDLTPAAVSKNVIRLEQQLGVRLFNRSTRQLRLTAEGEVFLASTSGALRALDEAVAEISRARGEPTGRVRISVGASFGRRYVLPLLPTLAARHRLLQVEVSLDNRAIDLVAEGFDIGIRGAVLRDSSLIARRIARLPLVLVATPAYLRKRGVPKAVRELETHDVLGVQLPNGSQIPWRFRRDSGRGLIEWPVAARLWVSDPEALIDLVLEHAGIAQIGLHHALPLLRSGRLKVVLADTHDPGDREIVLHYPHRQYLALRVRCVVDELLQKLSEHSDLRVLPGTLSKDFRAA